MTLGLSSMVFASTLALSPFSTPWTVGTADREAWPTKPSATETPPATETPATETPPATETKTGSEPDPSWNEPDPATTTPPADGTTPPADGTTPPGDPAAAVAPTPTTTAPPPVLPVPTAPPPVIIKSAHPTGIGLMISAGATGGLGWVIALSKLAALNRCKTAIGQAALSGSGAINAFGQCLSSGGSMLALTIPGWIVNDVTYGLAPAAGMYRGRYDGTNAAWEGKPQRPVKVFIGVGAGLLAAGIVGRVVTMMMFWRQFRLGDGTIPFNNGYGLGAHFVLQQAAAASIQAGGGLLAYGLSYKKARTAEDGRRKVGGLPQISLAPQVGYAYTGLGLNGRF